MNNQHNPSSRAPTPPVAPQPDSPHTKTFTPPAGRITSPHPHPHTPHPRRRSKMGGGGGGGSTSNAAFGGLIEGTVPPINVLIVEDNIINQKLLEAFMKRLRVRWNCAANGEEAVKKWRQGGFHLVLMDIQLPVMNGLSATKEIRRLERLNGVGVFPKTASGRSSASSTSASTCTSPSPFAPFTPFVPLAEGDTEGAAGGGKASLSLSPAPRASGLKAEDTLVDLSLFKSPVIIVALTASSLQSDRREALAAGCNDFLTKVCHLIFILLFIPHTNNSSSPLDSHG